LRRIRSFIRVFFYRGSWFYDFYEISLSRDVRELPRILINIYIFMISKISKGSCEVWILYALILMVLRDIYGHCHKELSFIFVIVLNGLFFTLWSFFFQTLYFNNKILFCILHFNAWWLRKDKATQLEGTGEKKL
jgi:hypothetical protein